MSLGPSENVWGERDVLDAMADPVRLRIMRYLSRVPEATVAELVERTHVSKHTVHRHIEALVALGVIRRRDGASDGQSSGRPPARFKLDPALRVTVLAVLDAAR